MANRDSTRTLDKETIIMVRDALLIGLASYGQVEQALANQKVQEQLGKPIPENQQVKHPTGMTDTVSRFAEALWAMYWILWEETTASNSPPCVEKHRLKCYPYMVRATGARTRTDHGDPPTSKVGPSTSFRHTSSKYLGQ